MARIVKIGTGGVPLGGWISMLLERLGGFIGDVSAAPGRPEYRVALARFDDAAPVPGGDVAESTADALMALPGHAFGQGEWALLESVRAAWRKGGLAEASMSGNGLSLDFARHRHLVTAGGRVKALHVAGRTVGVSDLPVVAVEGSELVLEGGSTVPLEERVSVECPVSDFPEFSEPGWTSAPRSPLAARIAKAVAGNGQGPEPQGMLFSTGQDGGAMVVVPVKAGPGQTLRFMPQSLQLVENGAVLCQTGCGIVPDLVGHLAGMRVQIAGWSGGSCEVAEAAVEIRTSA